MTKSHRIEIESVMLLILAAGVGVTGALFMGYKPKLPTKIYLPVMQTNNVSSPIPTPLNIPKPQVTTQFSPDGTKLLTQTVTTNKDLAKTFTYSTSDADGSNQRTIYTNSSGASATMSIPFNTWSPDDKYVFLAKNSFSGNEAVVLRADGQQITETDANFNVRTIFDAKNTGNVYDETTGWASETLLIINTTLQDGTKGPSYWLEIPSKAIIQLSTEF